VEPTSPSGENKGISWNEAAEVIEVEKQGRVLEEVSSSDGSSSSGSSGSESSSGESSSEEDTEVEEIEHDH